MILPTRKLVPLLARRAASSLSTPISSYSTITTSGSNASSSQSQSHYDCVVSGGGLVGSATALAIVNKTNLQNRRILVLEAVKPKDYSFPGQYSNRVSAINAGSKRLFQDISAWKTISDFRCKAIRGMNVWDSDGAVLSFPPPDTHDGIMFHIVENDLMVHSLSKELGRFDNVTIAYGKGVKSVSDQDEQGMTTVVLADREGADEEILRTKLLVGADGANSTVRKLAFNSDDNPYVSWKYHQMGVVANLKLSAAIPNDVAWQKFVSGSGPIALLPLSEESCSLVWTLPTDRAQRALKLAPEEFVRELRQALGKFPKVPEPAPNVVEASQIAGFPLGLGHSSRYCRPGAVLVGDAAHRVHPLAGQGVNLGFGDASALADALSEGAASGETFAAHARLLDYETARQRANLPVMAGVDFLQKVYAVDFAPFGAARAAGVAAVNSSPALKRFFAGLASG